MEMLCFLINSQSVRDTEDHDGGAVILQIAFVLAFFRLLRQDRLRIGAEKVRSIAGPELTMNPPGRR